MARLLPWATEDGKRCLLSTDDTSGFLSRLADDMEAIQLDMGSEVLEHARKVLDDPKAARGELRYAGARLAECLTDALRVAESRGGRIPVADDCESKNDPPEAQAEASA
ncbi:hypothetical protein OIE62_11610 [Streptomyces scopuliridis]|uniref:Uncharacterized protein n=1 Tax=Streptomyces scopuliridis TaxID=452529 RepID=A0ACD4ZYA3_9ACTN|nr:hypothetical protein OG835_29785 [Streptomyces scopuliridis]WSC10863.1 hypothetical protein OIE62_11610 [Streptomyces scopuliridis]